MPAEFLELHQVNPQKRFLAQAAEQLRQGAVIAYPTDSCYALGCQLDDKAAAERLRRIRDFDKHHQFTLVCRDLSEIAHYAKVDNWQFRILKLLTPGPYTFILPASKDLPKRLSHEKRKTIGIRIPDHVVAQALVEALGGPLISCTLQFPGEDQPVSEPQDAEKLLLHSVDLVLDAGNCGLEPTTVIDLSGDAAVLVRQGRGDVSMLGLS